MRLADINSRSKPLLRIWSLGAAALVMFAALSPAEAQRPPGGGRGGPGGGFGGGGFRGGPGGGPPGGDYLQLLRGGDVQDELKLTATQKTSIETMSKELEDGMTRKFGTRESRRELSDEEREKVYAEMQAASEQINQVVKQQVEKMLQPAQFERLQQISLQRRGSSALSDPEIAAKLKITDAQKEQLTKVQEKNREAMRQMFEGGRGGGGSDMQKKMEDLRFSRTRQSMEVLTASQREEFEKMQGPPFQGDASSFFRGRGASGDNNSGGESSGGGRRPFGKS